MTVKNWLRSLDLDPDKAIDASNRISESLRHEISFFDGVSGIFQEVVPFHWGRPAYDFIVLFVKLPLNYTFPEGFEDVILHPWNIEEEGYGFPMLYSNEALDSLERGFKLSKIINKYGK